MSKRSLEGSLHAGAVTCRNMDARTKTLSMRVYNGICWVEKRTAQRDAENRDDYGAGRSE